MVLFDVNALIALAWPAHEHHASVTAWFSRHADGGWATCTVTQAGFIRLLSQPAVAGRVVGLAELSAVLKQNTGHAKHRFLSLDFEVGDILAACTGGVVGHRQVTDALLLTAAMRHGARFLTFDTGVRQLLATEAERTKHLIVLR